MKALVLWVRACLVVGLIATSGQVSASFVNFETAPIHPVALSPDGRTLAVCNLPDGRVQLFDVSSGIPVPSGDVPVGIDPVSCRFRTTNELWVANFISSSINVVDVTRKHVAATLSTVAGPADVVFAGMPQRAFVSCARSNTVMVFDPATRLCLTNVIIDGDRPKAMAVSPDGSKVYLAIFESGNASTILVGDALKHPAGPYGGQFPVPYFGTNLPSWFFESITACGAFEDQRPDSLIVKKNAADRWVDDNNSDWTEFISGTNSAVESRGLFHRPQGWDMPDRDLAAIDTSTYEVTYASGLMNICMDVAVNPASGMIAVVGTDATNERRFEPDLRGKFIHVNLALVDPVTLTHRIVNLNPHLDYSASTVPQALRDQSVGDPRGIIWNAAGTRGYVTGMGSRNLVLINAAGERVASQPIELEEGPTGLALHETRGRVYVLNRFAATLSTLDAATLTILTNVPLHDPTPSTIKLGRKHLYDTRRNSGLGQLACASCHVDARFDRLAWDLGPGGGSGDGFIADKGPLVTQTLQDIISSEPESYYSADHRLHWRGDRIGIEDFNGTFTDLLGKDALLSTNEMQEFKEFLKTILFPPNPFRNVDDSLPADLPLPGHRNLEGEPLPNGNAQRGLALFSSNCMGCHQKQNGRGQSLFDDPCGIELVFIRREAGRPFKIAQLRSLPDKVGMDLSGTTSRAGFGFRFDGRDDGLARFFKDIEDAATGAEVVPTNDQELADMTAFLLAFSGTKYIHFTFDTIPAKDPRSGVGRQVTLTSPSSNALALAMLELADSLTGRVDLVARGIKDGLHRGWLYERDTGLFQSDRNDERISPAALFALAAPGHELTLTVVSEGTGRRLGIDRDEDSYYDRTELELGFDPIDRLSHASNAPPRLESIASIVVHPGMSIAVTVSASDPDAPAQALTFTLVRDTPAGATLDSTTGLFSWIPTAEQSDRTYRIGVQVSDNGSPSLTDTLTFEVTVVTLRIVRFEPELAIGPQSWSSHSIHSHIRSRVQFTGCRSKKDWRTRGGTSSRLGAPRAKPGCSIDRSQGERNAFTESDASSRRRPLSIRPLPQEFWLFCRVLEWLGSTRSGVWQYYEPLPDDTFERVSQALDRFGMTEIADRYRLGRTAAKGADRAASLDEWIEKHERRIEGDIFKLVLAQKDCLYCDDQY